MNLNGTMHVSALGRGCDGPVMLTVDAADDPHTWGRSCRTHIEALLDRHKAILLRGLPIGTTEQFRDLLSELSTDLLDYSERSTPRARIDEKIYTSTEYPRTDEIPMHNENSYSVRWPRRVVFCCLRPASAGGATPIADSRLVFAQLDEGIRQRFLTRKVKYVRNYGAGIDLSWQDVFQTDDRARVEAYCDTADIQYEWFDGGEGLHTEQVRPAALRHVPSGACVWFNQAHLFHVSSLDATLRTALCSLFSPDRLPRHACYGDGTPIEEEVLDEIRRLYAQVRISIEWQPGDVLLLDNLFYAHGRLPFTGERRVIVAMDALGGADTVPL